jgi:hypothetical protein
MVCPANNGGCLSPPNEINNYGLPVNKLKVLKANGINKLRLIVVILSKIL